MKKILLGTTAVVALGTMSAEAFAADKISLGLGGFMRQYVAVSNSDEVAATHGGITRAIDLAQWSNTEVYFTGSTTLDNGLSVAARVEMEADGENGGNNTDRSYLTVSSDAMGAVSAGSLGHAGDSFRIGAPNAGNFDWGDFDNLANFARTGTTNTNTAGNARSANDITDMGDNSAKLVYVSPTFADMVTVFASYSAAEGAGSSNGQNLTRGGTAPSGNDGSTIGAALSGEFSGASVEAAAIHFNNGSANLDVNNFGLSVGMAGFTVSGAYSDFNDQQTASSALDGEAWELGVGYETGPYALTARYMNSSNKGTTATTGDNEDTQWAVDATYDMGAGVKLAASYFDSSFDPEGTTANTNSVDVSGVLAGIEVGF